VWLLATYRWHHRTANTFATLIVQVAPTISPGDQFEGPFVGTLRFWDRRQHDKTIEMIHMMPLLKVCPVFEFLNNICCQWQPLCILWGFVYI
jgi:hypothetical protein